MKQLAWIPVAALATLFLPADASAQLGVKLFGALVYVSPLSDSDIDVGGITQAVGASSEFGYNFGAELRTSSLLGIELDYMYAKEEIEAETAGLLGTTEFRPISATLNFHVPVLPVDLYGGPTISYVKWGDFEAEGGGEAEIDSEFAFGLSAGLELSILPKIHLMGGLRWLNVSAEPEGGNGEVDVNPLFARIGAAFKL